jgi:hypothetical protein
VTDPVYDGESDHSPSFRRVWKRRSGAQGSSNLSLKAMAVLYDANRPLTRDELAEGLLARLDAYERDYLEAWALRRLDQQAKWKSKDREVDVVKRNTTSTSDRAIKRWLTEVFAARARSTQTLIRDLDGRFRPGARAPRVLTMDGQLKRFTPEARKELEQAEHDRGRTHLAAIEFRRIAAALDTNPRARAELLANLVRRLFDAKEPYFSQVLLNRELKHLLTLTDSPAVKEAVLRLAVEYLLTGRH